MGGEDLDLQMLDLRRRPARRLGAGAGGFSEEAAAFSEETTGAWQPSASIIRTTEHRERGSDIGQSFHEQPLSPSLQICGEEPIGWPGGAAGDRGASPDRAPAVEIARDLRRQEGPLGSRVARIAGHGLRPRRRAAAQRAQLAFHPRAHARRGSRIAREADQPPHHHPLHRPAAPRPAAASRGAGRANVLPASASSTSSRPGSDGSRRWKSTSRAARSGCSRPRPPCRRRRRGRQRIEGRDRPARGTSPRSGWYSAGRGSSRPITGSGRSSASGVERRRGSPPAPAAGGRRRPASRGGWPSPRRA